MMAAEEEARQIEAEAKAEAERIAEAKEVDAAEQAVMASKERDVAQTLAGEQTQVEGQHERMPKSVRIPVVRRRKPRRVKGPILL